MKTNTIALVCTLLNEAESLQPLLDSIDAQSHKPDEVVICDGGSTDGTLATIRSWRQENQFPVKLMERAGANIATGRNIAISACQSSIICVTDGGCVLDKYWLENISRPLLDGAGGFGVVYGKTVAISHSIIGKQFSVFYEAKTRRHKTETELSSRSVAFRKSVWEEVGGYPEWLKLAGEDTYFFRLLAKVTKSMFAKDAFVYWHHGADSLFKIYKQQARNSTASGELNSWPPLRYQVLFVLYTSIATGLVASVRKHQMGVPALALLLAVTFRQAPSLFVIKNKSLLAFVCLPAIALARDMGMIGGYFNGQRIRLKKGKSRISRNVF